VYLIYSACLLVSEGETRMKAINSSNSPTMSDLRNGLLDCHLVSVSRGWFKT
jgi:hypothetical protein